MSTILLFQLFSIPMGGCNFFWEILAPEDSSNAKWANAGTDQLGSELLIVD
jgi:hypothetical protein